MDFPFRGFDVIAKFPSWHSLPFAASAAASGRGSPFHSLSQQHPPAICRLLSSICCWGSYRRSPPGCRSCALPCCKSRGLLRLRLRQVSRLKKSMANTRKHVALIRSSRWVARRLGGTAAASAQVGEGFLSSHLLGHRCAQLRSTRLVVFALWRKNASVCTGCRVRANHRFEGTACKLGLQVRSAHRAPAAPQAKC
jgi:hypothetical protein